MWGEGLSHLHPLIKRRKESSPSAVSLRHCCPLLLRFARLRPEGITCGGVVGVRIPGKDVKVMQRKERRFMMARC